MQEIDRKAISEYGISSLVLMENAGRAVAEEIVRIVKPRASISVVCGKGNNGGDGLVCARYLHNKGFKVYILLLYKLENFKGESDFAKNLIIVRKMSISVTDNIVEFTPDEILELLSKSDVIVDAIFGTGLEREIKGAERKVIEAINASGKKVAAVDVPSGLDCNSGFSLGICVKAHKTITMSLPKVGFDNAKSITGEIVVADIGIPVALLE